MAPVPKTSDLVLSPGFSFFAVIIFCSVLTVASLVAIFVLWGYERYRGSTKISNNVDIESKPESPSIVTIPIPELPLSADWVEFEHEGKTYRYTRYQAQALLSIILTSTTPKSPTESIKDPSSLPSLDSDEGSDELSNDDLDVYDPRMNRLCSSPTFLDIPKFMETDLCGADVPEICIHECEDPEPTNDDLKDICLSTSLSGTHLDMDFLSERSCYASRYTCGDEEDYSTPDKVMQSILGSLGSSVRRTPSRSPVVPQANRESFRRAMVTLSGRSGYTFTPISQ